MPIRITKDAWRAAAISRFGVDTLTWRFRCPCCGHIAAVSDWKAAGATEGEVAFSCVGRHLDKPRDAFGGKGDGPCNYAGGGLFRLNPIIVMDRDVEHQVFDFGDQPLATEGAPP